MQRGLVPLLAAAGVLVLLAAALLAALAAQPRAWAVPEVALAPESEVTLEHFMAGLACIESSGSYEAVNSESGALGKYQIMPRNWRVWARRFIEDAAAEPTPQNQELVARMRIERLHGRLDSWRRVAYWWLTGNTTADETRWTDKARGYVDSVMQMARRDATPALAWTVPQRCRPVTAEATAGR